MGPGGSLGFHGMPPPAEMCLRAARAAVRVGCYTSVKGISESLGKVLSTQKHASLNHVQGFVTQTTLRSYINHV